MAETIQNMILSEFAKIAIQVKDNELKDYEIDYLRDSLHMKVEYLKKHGGYDNMLESCAESILNALNKKVNNVSLDLSNLSETAYMSLTSEELQRLLNDLQEKGLRAKANGQNERVKELREKYKRINSYRLTKEKQ